MQTGRGFYAGLAFSGARSRQAGRARQPIQAMTVQIQQTGQGQPAADLCRTPRPHLVHNRGRKNCPGSFFSMDSVGIGQNCRDIHERGKKHRSGFSLILLQIC